MVGLAAAAVVGGLEAEVVMEAADGQAEVEVEVAAGLEVAAAAMAVAVDVSLNSCTFLKH